MRKLLPFIFLAFLPLVSNAQRSPDCDLVDDPAQINDSGKRLGSLLAEKKFAAVEDEVNDKLRRHDAGSYSDSALSRSISVAVAKNVALEPLLDQWVATSPGSFSAHFLRGKYHAAAGYVKRGSKPAGETSAEQFAAMEAEFVKAAESFRAAMKLKPNSALPHAELVEIAKTFGQVPIEPILMEGERADPRSDAIHFAAIGALAPKWGGSFEELDAYTDHLLKLPLSKGMTILLQNNIERVKADHYLVVTKELTKALDHAQRANALCAGPTSLRLSLDIARKLEIWPVVVESAGRLVEQEPRNARAFSQLGWGREKLERFPEAIQAYERAAELGDDWAQNKLGALYSRGERVPKDLVRARTLFEAAAARGNTNARDNLGWLLKANPQ